MFVAGAWSRLSKLRAFVASRMSTSDTGQRKWEPLKTRTVD